MSIVTRCFAVAAILIAGGACKGKDPDPAPSASAGSLAGSSSAVPRGSTAPSSSGSSGAAATASEAWVATIVLPTELRDLIVTFAKKDAGWSAELEIPGISKAPAPLSDVTYAADRIAFTLGKTHAEVYELKRAGDEATGVAKIGGTEFVVKMARLAPGESTRAVFLRPQTPKPPFPYESREVVVDAPDGGKLAGTLTIPKGTGPFPAVLLISGSGQQDRDETIFRHKPYLILSDRLTRSGFVTLRYDDRQSPGGKTIGNAGTLETEIADDSACVAFLKTQKEIDPKRIGLVGHSTGGMVAPNVAVKTHDVAFIVSLAGVAVSGRELVPLQLELEARSTGTPESAIKEIMAAQTKVGAAAAKDPSTLRAVLVEMMKPDLAKALGHDPTNAELEQALARPLAEATAPWTVSFFRLDPRVAWKALSIPVLLVVGDKDTQVPADVTIKTLLESLSPAARALATTKKLPGLNHLFQHAIKTGKLDEYALIEESFDPATLDLVDAWLAEHAKAK